MKPIQTKPKTEPTISKTSIVKLLALAIFGIALGLSLSSSLLKFAINPSLETSIWLLICVMLFPISIGFFSVLIPKQKFTIIFITATTVALLSFFITKTSPPILLVTFIINTLLLWFANHAGRTVYNNMLIFKWLHMSPYVIKPVFTTMAIFLTVAYMTSVPIEDTDFTKPIFTNAIGYTGTYLSMASPNTTWDSSVYDFVLNMATAKGATFENNEEKEKIVEESIANLNKNISDKLKTTIVLEPEDILKDATFHLIDTSIRAINANTSYVIIFILGTIIFLTLFYTFKFLSTFTVLVGYVLFKFLGLTKFYSIALEDRKKETLML